MTVYCLFIDFKRQTSTHGVIKFQFAVPRNIWCKSGPKAVKIICAGLCNVVRWPMTQESFKKPLAVLNTCHMYTHTCTHTHTHTHARTHTHTHTCMRTHTHTHTHTHTQQVALFLVHHFMCHNLIQKSPELKLRISCAVWAATANVWCMCVTATPA